MHTASALHLLLSLRSSPCRHHSHNAPSSNNTGCTAYEPCMARQHFPINSIDKSVVMQGRPLLARLGRRTVLILDMPYVHQLLEAYVSKLFALSYGAASVDVHGADPTDTFVHSFTHRQVFFMQVWFQQCQAVTAVCI